MVDDELSYDADAAPMGFLDEGLEGVHIAIRGVNAAVVGDVIAVVQQRRGIERKQPDGGDPEVLDVVQALHQSREVAHAVIGGVLEGLDVHLVDDRVHEPVVGGGIDGDPGASSCAILPLREPPDGVRPHAGL